MTETFLNRKHSSTINGVKVKSESGLPFLLKCNMCTLKLPIINMMRTTYKVLWHIKTPSISSISVSKLMHVMLSVQHNGFTLPECAFTFTLSIRSRSFCGTFLSFSFKFYLEDIFFLRFQFFFRTKYFNYYSTVSLLVLWCFLDFCCCFFSPQLYVYFLLVVVVGEWHSGIHNILNHLSIKRFPFISLKGKQL